MCEQTEVEYLDGDVVWVKLGPCWWPGEVQGFAKLPPEIVKDFKKPPIAVVKFFQEDQYEYIKNLNHIYKYNCRKKNDFIKKGLDMHRAKNAFMDKFPADVCHAETLTGGDPDIITNDEFLPEQKKKYQSIFGTPTPMKKIKPTTSRGRPSYGSTPRSSRPSISPQRRITHPRFTGSSDHEIRILEQSTPVAPVSHYTCHICGFESSRLNVIVLHNRSHSNGTYVSPSKAKLKKMSKKNKRKTFATTNSIDEDIELIRQGVTISTEETSDSEDDLEKRKMGIKRKNNKAANNASKKVKMSSICNNLLADWGDSDEDTETNKPEETAEPDGEDKKEKDTVNTAANSEANKSFKNVILADWFDKNTDDESPENSSAAAANDKKMDVSTDVKASEKTSCFDFEDEEESTVLEKTPGRKIPRVIPSKRVSKDTEDNIVEGKEKAKLEAESSEKFQKDKEEKEESTEPDLAAFNSILNETIVPDITSLPDVTEKKEKKSEESSNLDKTNGVMKKKLESDTPHETTVEEIKSREPEPIVATIPKKRIVRNFEEFENLLNEQKNIDTEPTKPKSTLELSKLKSQVMSKLNEPPVKKSPKEVPRIETPEPDSEVDSKTEDESQSSESFQKKISQSESEDTDIEKKDNTSVETVDTMETISKELDIETLEERSVESTEISERSEETREELPETDIEPVKVGEPVLEEYKSEVSEDASMEVEVTMESMEEKNEEVEEVPKEITEEKMIEEPVLKELAVEEHTEEETPKKYPTVEETAEEEPAVEEPAVEEPVLEEPVVEEPTTEEPFVEKHGVEEPVVEESYLEEPLVEEPVMEEPVVEEPVVEESVVEEPIVEEPIVEEPVVEEPIVEEPVVEEPVVEEPIVEEPVVEEPSVEESVMEEPVVEEPIVEEPVIEEPIEEIIEEKEIVEKNNQTIFEEELSNENLVQEDNLDILKPIETEQVMEQETVVEEERIIEEIQKTPEVQENFQKTEETRSQKMLANISDICSIDNVDNLSGLSTLAAVSELTGNLFDKQETLTVESPVTESEIKEEISTIDEVTNPPSNVTDDPESRDMTPVQDELPETPPLPKPVQTLANFSMDFSDSNSESTIIKTVVKEDVVPEKIIDNIETSIGTTDSEESKIEICEPEHPPASVTDVPSDFESIESEIEKITSMETTSDKLNSFPENISQVPQDIPIESSEITYRDFQLADTGTSIPGLVTTEFITKLNEPEVPAETETTLESEIAKLTDTHPDTEVVQEQQQNTSSSKLLEILTDSKRTEQHPIGLSSPSSRTIISSGGNQKVQMVISGDSKTMTKKFDPKTSKFVIKSATPKSSKSNRPIILSEKIIKPISEMENVSVKKVTSKRTYQDVEDIDTFIIQKPTKKNNTGEVDQQDIILRPKTEVMKYRSAVQRGRGKPKIIEQTIIKAADVVQQVPVSTATSDAQTLLDDSMFDINSMPIVLSDQILTPESIENIPMVMTDLIPTSSVSTPSHTTVQTVVTEKPQQQTIAVKRGGAIQQVKLLNKGKVTSQPEPSPKFGQNVVVKNIMPRNLGKNQKVYQSGSKTLKHNPAIITQPGKPGKFIILPNSTTTTTGVSKYTVGKRLTTIKSSTAVTNPTMSKQLKSIPSIASEPTGNKIMIVTNQQGVQSRVLLTPAQQKMLGCKVPGTKVNKPTQVKSGMIQKSILTSKGTIIGAMNNAGIKSPQTIVTSKGQMVTQSSQMIVTSEGQVLTPITQKQLQSNMHKSGHKIKIQSSRVILPDKSGDSSQKGKMNLMGTKTKTLLLKGAQGQTYKKLQAAGSESKNILYSQAGHKSQLVSLGGQQMSGGLSGKQVVVTSKGQIIKPEGKVSIPKQADKLHRITKTSVSTQPRIMSKSSRTQVLLTPTSKQLSSNVAIPPLAPITGQIKKEIVHAPKHTEKKLLTTVTEDKPTEIPTTVVEKTAGGEKQPNQLIIQDAMGNQTTVTEGQILALPSGETVDGQPQSYVLVTVDESGNLAPISNDTLMSLDPSFAAGGDMNNIVLQIDPGAQDNQATQDVKPAETTMPTVELPAEEPLITNQQIVEPEQQLLIDNQQMMLQEQPVVTAAETQLVVPEQQMMQEPETFVTNTEETTQVITSDAGSLLQETQQTAVACSINNGDTSQQLIITGDPESTQKFLASLSEGNTDLSSLLSGADGNIIINTDGQQILLNTDSENQILLSVNSDNLGLIQASTENDPAQNEMFVTQQAIKNQDILAAALADTDVFQQEAADKLITSQPLPKAISSVSSQLSPNSSLYPMNVSNVLETSLTLGSPIMTPLEVPSVNSKKIISDVESTLISQVPSSLELPITITDPSITQTVSQQVMLGNDLQTSLELPISISNTAITSIRSSEMNSSSFVYSLPTLDDTSDLEHKRSFVETSTVMTTDNIYNTSLTGSMSMPLLTEEPEIQPVEQESVPTSHEEIVPIVTCAPETSIIETETVISESDQSVNYSNLNTENIETLNTENISENIETLNSEHIDSLNTEHIASLNRDHIETLETEHIETLNRDHIQTLNTEHIENLNRDHIETLNTEQIETQNSEHIEILNTEHLNRETLNTEHIETLDRDHNETINTEHIETLNRDHNETINTEHIETLNTEHIETLSPEHIETTEHIETLNTENIETTVVEKIPSELQLPMEEEELDLHPTDICSSLSEPPPGMFDKTSFSNFLNKPDEETTSVSMLEEIETSAEIETTTNETCVVNEQINSLPVLTDDSEPENSDLLKTRSILIEKSTEESNLDIDYGVSESSDQQSETAMTQEIQRSELLETPNSDLNSPRLDIDENSVDIPIQPPIITNLSETFPENAPEDFNSHEESRKRVNEDDDDENDAKRTKISCD